MHTPSEELNYSKHDHVHCWEQENPPCGQKIKHFYCCICGTQTPEIAQREAIAREEGYIEGQKHAFGVDKERVAADARKEERERIEKMLGHYTVKARESQRIADLTTEQFMSLFTQEENKEANI